MAFVYEVNGVKVQFDHEPTDADIDEAALNLGTSKAKPKSNMPKPVEGEGGAAFGVYPQMAYRPERQNDREASKEMGLQTVRGIASNVPAIAGIPGSVVNAVANAPRTAQDISNRYQKAREAFTGQEPQVQPLPEYNQVTPYDMNYFAQLTPGPQPTSPQGQLAFGAGQLAGAPIVPPILKAAAPAVGATTRFVKDALPLVAHPIDTAMMGSEAFMRGYRNPEMMGQQGSALMPIRPTYYPHDQVTEFQAGTRGPLQMSERPTSDLIKTPTQKWAQNMAPVDEAGQPLVAPQGKGFEGYMENLGAGYKQDPLKGVVDAITGVGGMALTGMPTPLSAISKAGPAIAARTLQKATGFEPNFNAADIHAAQGRAGLEANMPTQPALPAPGPVNPTLYANQQGVVTGQGGTSVPQQLSTPKQTPATQMQELAASKIKPVAPVTPATSPSELSKQQASWAARSGGNYTPPKEQAPAPAPAPTTGAVEPTPLPPEAITAPAAKAQPLPTDEILKKARQITKDESKQMAKKARADEKAKAEGKEVTKEPVHPEIERIAQEAEQPTKDFIKSLELENKTPEEKQTLKVSLIDEERKLGSAIRDNRITKALNNDEIEALMKRYHSVTKAREVIQNEQVRASNMATWEKNQAAIAERNASKGAKGVKPSLDELRAKAAAKKNNPDVSQMLIGEETPKSKLDEGIVNKRTFNQDLQKYRYGSSKEPLTYDEFKHLESSDFIEKQDITDILKGIEPRHTEHSMWYKDKNGVTKNVDAHNGRLTVTEIDKKNPNREITYSKDNPSDEDHWYFHKTVRENGAKVSTEKFEVTDSFSPRHEKLKDWPEEFTNSKYDYE